ncbi:MAG: hypothetical protein MN733_15045 [Nitrososphaera sp.]|nr:hypothetical protein [Nitrososphaera sp.]
MTDMNDTKWWIVHDVRDEDYTISGPYDTESEALAFGYELFNTYAWITGWNVYRDEYAS